MPRESKLRLVKESSSTTRILSNQRLSLSQLHHLCRFLTIATFFFLFASGDILQERQSIITGVAAAFQNQHRNHNSNSNNHNMRGAWKSRGTNQRELVEQLHKRGIIRTEAVQKVMGLVDRGNYCSNDKLGCSYADRALGIGLGQTISAPHIHAYALEEIYGSWTESGNTQSKSKLSNSDSNSKPNHRETKILDVGCGSGYLTACFGRWLSPPKHTTAGNKGNSNDDNNDDNDEEQSILGGGGRVFGIDVRKDLVQTTLNNIQRADWDLLDNGIIDLSLRDGWKGLPEHAPFDIIHVGAAAERLPRILANQLAVGGVLIIPIGPKDNSGNQILYKIKRTRQSRRGTGKGRSRDRNYSDYYSSEESFDERDFEIESLLGVRYVPLVKGEDL